MPNIRKFYEFKEVIETPKIFNLFLNSINKIYHDLVKVLYTNVKLGGVILK